MHTPVMDTYMHVLSTRKLFDIFAPPLELHHFSHVPSRVRYKLPHYLRLSKMGAE